MYYKMNEDFLVHFGVPGMKWGVHKAKQPKDITKSGITRKKLEKVAEKNFRKKKKSQNVRKVLTKMSDEYNNSKEYANHKKAYEEYSKKIRSKEGATLNDLNKVVEARNASNKKQMQIAEKYRNEYAGALLKDLKYEDTKAGRDYVVNLLTETDEKKKH